MDYRKEMMRRAGVDSLVKKLSVDIIHITREDFSLLDATAENTIYYIAEPNGSVTMIKGENK